MGTVGLNFGSPTSGAGFDVSSTVASIVSNLQNVETPWKSQLTKLQTQDTAISSLGTLMSSLSNDMSALTDFQGIMAQKEGSSSDTNVLQLTAASTSAIAGTHTVVVKNLAQTSSGYLAPISSASDILTGSIELQVGSGAPQTITVTSSTNTLATLAAAINSSGVGITASVLTDATGSRLSLVSGTSGAKGAIAVTSTIAAATSTALSYTGTADAGTLTGIASQNDTLTGSMTLTAGSGPAETIVIGAAPGSPAAHTIYTGTASGINTLDGLASIIGAAGLGVTASIVTNSDGTSSLSLGSSGALAVSSSLVDTSAKLGYTPSATGKDAQLTVDGVNLTSASNTVTNLIPGITFQLLAPSATESDNTLEQVQVVIGNDNAGVESAVSQFVSDYNSLISAMNIQDGNDSSGHPEPLYGSPTLSLLQQQLLSGLNAQNPSGSLTSISANTDTTIAGAVTIAVAGGLGLNYSATADASLSASTGTLTGIQDAGDTLSGSISIQVGGGTAKTINVPPYSATSPSNNLSGLAGAINTTDTAVTASVVTNADGSSSLKLVSNTTGTAGTLTVASSIVDTSAQIIHVPTTSGNNTLSGLASAINKANIGVMANVVTSNGESILTLTSQTAGSNGALSVGSSIVATSDTALSYSDAAGYTSTTADTGTLTGIADANDALSGSISIQVGSGAAKTINVPPYSATSPSNNLSGLAGAINAADLGVSASVVTNTDGTSSLQIQSGTVGSAGALTVTSNILDTSKTSTANLSYTNSSDVSTLANLGITISNADNGTLTYDATSLDSILNSDYSGVVGFFQSANSWGQTFSATLTNAGGGKATGALSLVSSSNSNIESTLNADISKEDSLISAQQVSLTAELNSANEIMQEIPSQLQGVNELYSAITGYDQNLNG